MGEERTEIENPVEDLRNDIRERDCIIKELEYKRRYLSGMVDGLKFAIRCNGVSGGEVHD